MPNDMAEARAAKRAVDAQRKQSLADQVQDILSDPATNDELKRKLRYCQEEIRKGRDGGLVQTRALLIAEARRSVRFAA